MLHTITTRALLRWLRKRGRWAPSGAILAQLSDGGWHNRDDLIMAMYNGENEPDEAEAILRQLILALRQRGIKIETSYGRGYRRPPPDEKPRHPKPAPRRGFQWHPLGSYRYCNPKDERFYREK